MTDSKSLKTIISENTEFQKLTTAKIALIEAKLDTLEKKKDDTSNLKTSHSSFCKTFNDSIAQVRVEMTTMDAKLSELNSLINSTASSQDQKRSAESDAFKESLASLEKKLQSLESEIKF